MTISDDFYCKIGRMTVEFGNLDFEVGWLANHLARALGKSRVQRFTKRQLEQIKEWTKSHESELGSELAADLAKFAGDAISLYGRRPDGAHGMWLQEDGASVPWVLKLDADGLRGVPSAIDAAAVERMTEEAKQMELRLGALTMQFLKRFEPH